MQIPRYIAVNYTIKQYKLDFIYSKGAHVNLDPKSFPTPNRLGQTAVHGMHKSYTVIYRFELYKTYISIFKSVKDMRYYILSDYFFEILVYTDFAKFLKVLVFIEEAWP